MTVNTINAKDRCVQIIERFPKEHLPSLAESLEAMYKMIDEAADNAFCLALAERYEQNSDKDDQGTPIDELAKRWNIDLEADDE